MPEAGRRRIATVFNRRLAVRRRMTVSKALVAGAIRTHRYEIKLLDQQAALGLHLVGGPMEELTAQSQKKNGEHQSVRYATKCQANFTEDSTCNHNYSR